MREKYAASSSVSLLGAAVNSPNVYTYYSLLSGKKLYVTNFDLLELNGKGEGPLSARFVGFGYDIVNNRGHDPVLQYGTYKTISQKFRHSFR